MINLTSLMGKITGKSAPGQAQTGDAKRAGGEAGGEFAALVELAAQSGAGRDQAGLKLVVTNSTLPGGKALPGMGETGLPEIAELGLPGASQMGTPGTGGMALPGTGGDVASAPGSGLNVLTTAVGTAPKIAKTPIQSDEAALSAMTSLDPVVKAIDEDSQSSGKDDQPETLALAQPAEQIDPSAASMQAALAQMALLQTSTNPRASAEPGQALSTITSLPVQVATAAGDKPKADVKTPSNAFTLEAEAIGVGETATAASDDAQSAPTDSPRSRSSESSPITTAATTMISPLRAIVDSLPPVIQSTLAAAPVSAVTGPSTGEMLGDQVIDMGVSGQWIDRMAREITALSEGSGHSRFTLNPPHLGRLEVNLWQGQDGASLRLTAETDEAARRLSEGRPALQADARMAALNLGAITIEKATPSHESGRDQSQRQGGDQTSQMQQQSGGQGQGPGNNQTRAGNGQQQGEWVNRFVRDEPTQHSDAAALSPAQRAARGNVRFA